MSRDTENWSNNAENLALIPGKNYILNINSSWKPFFWKIFLFFFTLNNFFWGEWKGSMDVIGSSLNHDADEEP